MRGDLMARLTRPQSPVPLGAFRIALSVVLLARFWAMRHSILDVYGPHGFVAWDVTRAELLPGLAHPLDLAIVLGVFGSDPIDVTYGLVGLELMALLLLLAGITSRMAAIVAFASDYFLMRAGAGVLYGLDHFGHVALFYCMFMPVGAALTLPRWLRGAPAAPATGAAGLARRVLQLHLCIVYTSSGVEKACGPDWWSGEAIWRALTLPDFHWLDLHVLAHWPGFAALLGWGVLALESGYAFGMFFRRTRCLWLLGVISMHLGIGLFLNLGLFAGVMLLWNLSAFGSEALEDVRAVLARCHELHSRAQPS